MSKILLYLLIVFTLSGCNIFYEEIIYDQDKLNNYNSIVLQKNTYLHYDPDISLIELSIYEMFKNTGFIMLGDREACQITHDQKFSILEAKYKINKTFFIDTVTIEFTDYLTDSKVADLTSRSYSIITAIKSLEPVLVKNLLTE